MSTLSNILQLGIKELRTLARDPAMLLLIAYTFTLSVYSSANGIPETPHRASIAVVDEDRSPITQRIILTMMVGGRWRDELHARRLPFAKTVGKGRVRVGV